MSTIGEGQPSGANNINAADAAPKVDPNATAPATGTPPQDAAAAPTGTPTEPSKAAEPPKDVAPENYEPFKLPDGVAFNSEKFIPLAKELNLTQEKAQKLVDLATEHVKGVVDKQAEAWNQTREAWVNSLKADKEFGGMKFNENVDRAKRALKRFGSDGLVQFLDKTGYGDNPELIRMFHKIDLATSEDSSVNGSAPGITTNAADVIYGNSK